MPSQPSAFLVQPDLAPRIAAIPRPRIVVIGDVMLDRFVYGSVERISPEAPVPVLKFEREALMPGGAANVARNLCDLGASVELIGLAGNDSARAEIERHVETIPHWRLNLVVSEQRPTTTKTRFISGGHQIVRLDTESVSSLTQHEENCLVALVDAAVRDADAVVLSDYAKGALSERVIAAAISLANARGIPVVVDPKDLRFDRYAGATVLTPNKLELERALHRSCAGDAAIASAGAEFLRLSGAKAVVVTQGEKGMTLFEPNEVPRHFEAIARQVFDVSGAGDTVAATLAFLLAAGFPLAEAVYSANLAAGVVVEKAGTATIGRDELVAEIGRATRGRHALKIAGLQEAVVQRRRWSAAGKRVVFTNGCFDLLHPGHLSLLRQSRAAGDKLIVGMNSDASVRRLKGEGRPLQDQDSRAMVLAALEVVDLIVVFAEDTPLALITTLHPDVLVKGADYALDQVVGRDVVEGYGGTVILAALEAGHSTTATIDKMQRG
ncbi:MAG TPA: D-glycero-beta-D-manno-heptose-7-phosphate kinase [Rhizomicrobium sp.]